MRTFPGQLLTSFSADHTTVNTAMDKRQHLIIIATYAVSGAAAGFLLGEVVDMLLLQWMHDGPAFIFLCIICGAIIGIKVGQQRLQ